MHQCSCSGIQDSHKGEGHRRKIDAHGKSNAYLDCFHRRVRQPLQIRDFGQVVAHQRHIRSFHRDVASHASHGDADIGSFQGRRIIDAITDHADPMVFFLQFFDIPDLFLRQKFRFDIRDAGLEGKIVCRLFIIAGKQNCAGMHSGQPGDHIFCFLPQ